MITKIDIAGLRGIHQGTLDPLTMLTVIVGPSGAGKSTVLDALLIAASNDPGAAIAKVVGRRVDLDAGASWLFGRTSQPARAQASIAIEGDPRERLCMLTRELDPHANLTSIRVGIATRDFGAFRAAAFFPWGGPASYDPLTPDPGSGPNDLREVMNLPAAHLVEVAEGADADIPLVQLYSQVSGRVGRKAVDALLPNLRPGATGLMITVEADGTSVLTMDLGDHAVPVAALGSGNHALVRLALGLSVAQPGSLVLVEEPEVHQHPQVIYRAARLLLATVKRGVQVVLTTHSLELIDALVVLGNEEALKLEPGVLSVIRVVLDEKGTLLSSYFPDGMVKMARGDMDEDLR